MYLMKQAFYITLFIAFAYLLLGLLGQLLAIPPGNVTPVWPPSGFALACYLILGKRSIAGIIIGAFLVNTQAIIDASNNQLLFQNILAGLFIAAGSVLQPLIGSKLINYKSSVSELISNPSKFLYFCLVTPIICLVSSSIGSTALYISGVIDLNALTKIWLTWWLGDSIGILLLTPVILLLYSSTFRITKKLLHTIPVYIGICVITLFSFGAFFYEGPIRYPLAFLPLPVLLIFALKFNTLHTMLGTLILSSISITLTLLWKGSFCSRGLKYLVTLITNLYCLYSCYRNDYCYFKHATKTHTANPIGTKR